MIWNLLGQKLIGLALNILFNPEEKVFVFDEFDDAFHQELSGTLLEAFNAMETNTQFILTSHELHLMDNQLRKDQIYFTDKNYRGASELYALYDFEADPKRSRRYHILSPLFKWSVRWCSSY